MPHQEDNPNPIAAKATTSFLTYASNEFSDYEHGASERVIDLIMGDLVRETNIFPNQVERAKELIRQRLAAIPSTPAHASEASVTDLGNIVGWHEPAHASEPSVKSILLELAGNVLEYKAAPKWLTQLAQNAIETVQSKPVHASEQEAVVQDVHRVLGALVRALDAGALSMNPSTLLTDIRVAFKKLDATLSQHLTPVTE